MSPKTKKVLAGSLIILAVIGYLTYSGMQESMVYFVTVKEFIDGEAKYKDEGIRITGLVVEGSVQKIPEEMRIIFEIMDEKEQDKKIKVDYKGQVPDIFNPGIQVVVEGKLTSERIFKATVLLAKCPSKYQEKPEE